MDGAAWGWWVVVGEFGPSAVFLFLFQRRKRKDGGGGFLKVGILNAIRLDTLVGLPPCLTINEKFQLLKNFPSLLK